MHPYVRELVAQAASNLKRAERINDDDFFIELVNQSHRTLSEVLAIAKDQSLLTSCVECGKPIVLAGPGRRRSRRYCSNACRSKAYRERLASKRMEKQQAQPSRHRSGET